MEKITIQTHINSSIDKVWDYYTNPNHITKWNNASDDWHTTHAETDLRVGGKFLSRMEAKDKSAGFDFEGVYDQVESTKLIEYTMPDSRHVRVTFNESDDGVDVSVTFDPEMENSIEMQREGWQAILDNFKKYIEES